MGTQRAAVLALGLLLATSSAAAQTTPWQSAAAPAPASADPARDEAELRATERLLAGLDADARDRRAIGLGVGLGGGAVTVGVGAWLLARDDSPPWPSNIGTYICAAGAGLLVGGVVNAALPTYLHELRDGWLASAALPVAERRANLGVILDGLAVRARAARRLSGWLSLGLGGAALLGAVLIEAGSGADIGDDAAALILGVGGASLMASSVPALTLPSPVEFAQRFWQAGVARPRVRLMGASVLPTRGGALAGVTLVF